MPKLYFKYGAMGCSKSAQALMCKYNYEQKGFRVLLMKPSLDTRDNEIEKSYVASRIGLKSECLVFSQNDDLHAYILNLHKEAQIDVVIIDEAQFCTARQITDLKDLTEFFPVLCYGLKTNFKTFLFEGSKRLIELADSLSEIKSVCKCGRKATVNARLHNKKVITEGGEILIGGDESYESMCYECWKKEQK